MLDINNQAAASRLLQFSLAATMLLALLGSAPLRAQAPHTESASSILKITAAADLPVTRRITLGLHKAMVLELPVDAQDAIISHPNTVDASVLTARRVMIYAKAAGEANLFVLGRDGRKLVILDITVKRDLGDLSGMLARLLPGSRIKLAMSGDGVVLSGVSWRLPMPAAPRRSPASTSTAPRWST